MLAIGAEIEGYRIERLLGRGGMGEVYEATQLELGRRVAFKVLHAELLDDDGFRQRFRREGRLQAALEHPNVVTVYEAGEIDQSLFLAMRLIDGKTLKELILAAPIDPARAIRLLAPVADALDAAHEEGLVHRDVKPQNILVSSAEQPYLADFGLTRGRGHSVYTKSGHMVGTIDYMSPEQLRGEEAGPASDVYALAAVLYESLVGSVPFVRPTDAAVIYAHMNDEPPSAAAAQADLPPGIDAVIAQGMAKEPERRPGSAGEMIAAAAAVVGVEAPAPAARPPRPAADGTRAAAGPTRAAATPADDPRRPSSSTRVQRRRRLAAPVLGAVALVAIAAIALLVGRSVGGETAAAMGTTVSGPAVSLRAPSSWAATAAGERPAIPGLALENPIGAAPASAGGSGVSAGTTAATGSLLLPADFVDRVVGELPPASPVELGELEALRYRGVRVRGFDRELTLYAAPSTAGVATVACYSFSATDFEQPCESVAQTLELTRGTPYPLAPGAEAERGLRATIAQLGRQRRTGRERLEQVTTTSRQAAAAEQLARSYERAARRLGRLDVSPVQAGEVAAVRAAVAGAARAYDDLATATAAEDEAAFGTAEQAVDAAEARLGSVLAALGPGRE
jgi:Protein kinase domain